MATTADAPTDIFAAALAEDGDDAYVDALLDSLGYGEEVVAIQEPGSGTRLIADAISLDDVRGVSKRRRGRRKREMPEFEEQFVVMPRPTFVVRVMAIGLIGLLAAMTLVAALVADSVRQMTGGIAEQSPVLQVSVLERPPPPDAVLRDEKRFALILEREHQRAGDLHLWRAQLLAEDEAWYAAADAFRKARDLGSLGLDDHQVLTWAGVLMEIWELENAQALLRTLDLGRASNDVRSQALDMLHRLDERLR